MSRPIQKQPETSAFLGILEGKRKRAKAEAEAKVIAAKAAAEKEVLAAKQAAAASGYKTEEQVKSETETVTAISEAKSSSTLYYVLGGIVLAVMVGLYFITKKR